MGERSIQKLLYHALRMGREAERIVKGEFPQVLSFHVHLSNSLGLD